MEPEVVATSPYPGKSRVPVCCGFDSLKLVFAAGVAPALATFSTSYLCIGLREQMEWSLQPVMLRQEIYTKEIRRLLHGGGNGLTSRSWQNEGWSQSPVLPRTERAYETHLSAGSTAMLAHGHRSDGDQNGALALSCTGLIRLPSEGIADDALKADENWRP